MKNVSFLLNESAQTDHREKPPRAMPKKSQNESVTQCTRASTQFYQMNGQSFGAITQARAPVQESKPVIFSQRTVGAKQSKKPKHL